MSAWKASVVKEYLEYYTWVKGWLAQEDERAAVDLQAVATEIEGSHCSFSVKKVRKLQDRRRACDAFKRVAHELDAYVEQCGKMKETGCLVDGMTENDHIDRSFLTLGALEGMRERLATAQIISMFNQESYLPPELVMKVAKFCNPIADSVSADYFNSVWAHFAKVFLLKNIVLQQCVSNVDSNKNGNNMGTNNNLNVYEDPASCLSLELICRHVFHDDTAPQWQVTIARPKHRGLFVLNDIQEIFTERKFWAGFSPENFWAQRVEPLIRSLELEFEVDVREIDWRQDNRTVVLYLKDPECSPDGLDGSASSNGERKNMENVPVVYDGVPVI